MKEAIETVLNNETLTTNEERVEAITKSLATLVMPKDKYNDLNAKYQDTENKLSTLSTEFNEFKQSKMTADEKRQAELQQFEADKKANALMKSELEVQKLFLKNGIEIKDDDTELRETLSNIVSEDSEKSLKLANSFISILNKTKEDTQKQTTTNLLNNTPKPDFGNPNVSNTSNLESLQTKYEEAVKANDVVAMATYQRLMFEEQSKKTI